MQEYYSIADVARLFKLHQNTVRNHRKAGLLKGQKIGRQWRFTEQDIEEYLKRMEEEGLNNANKES